MAPKKPTKKKTSKTGRPTVMTPETLANLKDGFLMGFTDREACLFAGIVPSTLYDYCDANPDFAEQKELLKENTRMLAKRNVHTAIRNADKQTSTWYLERKAKDEFSTRQEMTGKDGKDLPTPLLHGILPDDSTQKDSGTQG